MHSTQHTLIVRNTLSRQHEPIAPQNGNTITLYHCGPTVYNFAHIGNLRSYVFADILRRTLEYNGYRVRQVINITDIGHLQSDADDGEDKMTLALKREGKPLTLSAMKEVATMYRNHFVDDLQELNIRTPHELPYASDHVPEYIALIQALTDKDHTYTTSDGVYFDTDTYPDYGKLAGGDTEKNDGQSRIGENSEKRNSRDFALWKFNDELGYDSPFGKGFPGWHIECSAMAMKYLGETIDIHTGGIDHIPIHHTNEIAQSECATGKPFARAWMHNAFMNIDGAKIAKSVGNVAYLKDLKEKKYDPLAYRYFLLTARYSSPMNFSLDALGGAQTALERLVRHARTWYEHSSWWSRLFAQEHALTRDAFHSAINNDLDTPRALSVVWELVHDDTIPPAVKLATLLSCDTVLGLRIKENLHVVKETTLIPDDVTTLLTQRKKAREDKDWKASDELRDKIRNCGFIVHDTKEGQEVEKASGN